MYQRTIKGKWTGIKVNYFAPKGLFRKYVYGKMFYLGPDRRAAQQLASVIIGVSGFRRILGGPWQPEDLDFIDMAKEQVLRGRGRVVLKWGKQRLELEHMMGQGGNTKGSDEAVGDPGAAAAQSQDEGGVLTVGQAMDAFKNQVTANALVSESHKATLVGKIDSLKHVLPPDRGVASIGYDELTSLVNRLASRPKSTSTGKKISAQTAINLIAAARQFFNWLRDSGKWEEPRGFDRIFRINRKALLTNQERKQAAQGVDTFTVEELKKLWRAANKQNRLFLALGLNCGFAQMEIATLRAWEVDLAADTPRISRQRRKTEVFGRWSLWKVTGELLGKRLRQTPKNGEDYAILTRCGKQYVRYLNNRRTDGISQAWQKLVAKAGVRQLGFKYLRKTGADMVRRLGGLEMSETYLAHSEKTLARVYSNPDFDKLEGVLRAMELELKDVFLAE